MGFLQAAQTAEKIKIGLLVPMTGSNKDLGQSIIKAVRGSDLVIVHTEWNDFKSINFNKLNASKKLKIYDMRNIFSPSKIKSQGYKYFGIGR